MALIGCEKCGGEVCETARRCPHCGARRRPTKKPPKLGPGDLAARLLMEQLDLERLGERED